MPRRILFATDGSASAKEAVRFLNALPLAEGTEIRVVSVMDPLIERLLEQVQPGELHFSRHMVHEAEKALARPGIEVNGVLRSGDPAHQILIAAQEMRADLLVLGSSGQTGIASFLLGSIARNVAKHAQCSVLIARGLRHSLASVVLASDGSSHAEEAVRFAAAFPLPAATSLNLVHVMRPQVPMMEMTGIADETMFEMLRDCEAQARSRGEGILASHHELLGERAGTATAEVRTGDPAREILALAEERDADLIIAGARGASMIEGLLTGSVADRLLGKASCSVLLVR